MQRISPAFALHHRSDEPVCCRRKPAARGSGGNVTAAGITTLAPAFTQALPLLDTIPAAYSHEFHAELLYDLCAALVRAGLGGPDTWRKSKGSAQVFAQRAIMESIGEDRWNLLQRNVEYHLTVSDAANFDGFDRSGFDQVPDDIRLVLTIECCGAGFLKIGPAIEALEQEAEGLGAAFYWTLIHALSGAMRLYSHDDAFEYEERLREYAEQDDQNGGPYEFPEVEKALPECIRRTLKREHKEFIRESRLILRQHRKGKYRNWIEHLRKIQWFSRDSLWADRDLVEEGAYDSAPLPSLIVTFKEQDAIIACFDEERQYMLEGSSEPIVGVIFSPCKPEEVRRARGIAGRFVALNHELFQLVEELERWEKDHASAYRDRRKLPLRAA